MSSEHTSVCRLRVVAEADSGALMRVLERFQNCNVLPRRVIAEFGTHGMLHIQVDICGMTESTLTLITAKLGQVPTILDAYWHHA